MEQICRTCLKTADKLISLFHTPLLIFKIVAIAPIDIFSDDNLPQTICEECCNNIDKFFSFKEMIINNDTKLKQRHFETKLEHLNDTAVNGEIKIEKVGNVCSERDTDTLMSDKTVIEEHSVGNTDGQPDLHIGTELSYKDVYNAVHPNNEGDSVNVSEVYDGNVYSRLDKSTFADTLDRDVKLYSKRSVQCEKCGKAFKNSHLLRTHLKTVHDRNSLKGRLSRNHHNKNYLKEYKNISNSNFELDGQNSNSCVGELLSNEATSSKVSNGICNVCGILICIDDLNEHIKQHNEQLTTPEKTHICEVCGKSFTLKSALKQHTRSRHGDNSLKKFCSVCNKGFSKSSTLKRHMRVHTGKRSYLHKDTKHFECNICLKTFFQKMSLYMHLKSKHKYVEDQL